MYDYLPLCWEATTSYRCKRARALCWFSGVRLYPMCSLVALLQPNHHRILISVRLSSKTSTGSGPCHLRTNILRFMKKAPFSIFFSSNEQSFSTLSKISCASAECSEDKFERPWNSLMKVSWLEVSCFIGKYWWISKIQNHGVSFRPNDGKWWKKRLIFPCFLWFWKTHNLHLSMNRNILLFAGKCM